MKSLQEQTKTRRAPKEIAAYLVVAEEQGFEPWTRSNPGNRLAGGRTRPLCDSSRRSSELRVSGFRAGIYAELGTPSRGPRIPPQGGRRERDSNPRGITA